MLLMPPTMDDPLFPILFNAAFFAALDDRPQITMRKYAERYIRSIKEEKVKVEIVNPKEYLYLLRGCVWLLIIAPEKNMKEVRTAMRERMHIEGVVHNTLILQRLTPPLWGQVLISSKWLKSNQMKEENHVR